MNDSILNHLFLPHYLPSSKDDDYYTQDNYRNEHEILECMKEYLEFFEKTDEMKKLPKFQILVDCIKDWCVVQSPQITSPMLQDIIKNLASDHFLPLYFHAQNAAVLIEIDGNSSTELLISAWQVLLPNEEIMASLAPHLSCFPVSTYRLHDRSQLISDVYCELFKEFMTNTIQHFKSDKNSHEVNETRDVPESHYVCHWWIQQLRRKEIENNSDESRKFRKKHRDQIRWNNAKLPFRRSGLWMTVKVVFQTILVKHWGNIGTIVYKLLITHFLTYIIETKQEQCSIDLLVHCIRKIVRRLDKIENKLAKIESNDINEWIQYIKDEIKWKINRLLPGLDWQESDRTNSEENNFSKYYFKKNYDKMCKHSFKELDNYLADQNLNELHTSVLNANNRDDYDDISGIDGIPSLEELRGKFGYTIGIAVIRMEIWVTTCLKKWINRPSSTMNQENHFVTLLKFYEVYQNEALKYCYSKQGPTDPMGYSRFILTSLTIIHLMHDNLCKNPQFKRLEQHSIDIPNIIKLFEFLVLPIREDMKRAHDLYKYFSKFSHEQHPDLLSCINHPNAFGVHFAGKSEIMRKDLQKIRNQAEEDKRKKLEEVRHKKSEHADLMRLVNDTSCDIRSNGYHPRNCNRCISLNRADKITVNVFECPIPEDHVSALAVIFELQMPIEIRCYRDVVWQFVNRLRSQLKKPPRLWLDVPPHQEKLKDYYKSSIKPKVNLVSSVESATQTHFRAPPIATTNEKQFLFENCLKVEISPCQPITFEDEHRILTPQLDHANYKELQFTMNTTQFLQNDVIARLSVCSSKLNHKQFVEFGSFRSGHSLQWWNLFALFELGNLSIGEESVAILIIHSILQYGPVTTDLNISFNPWCPPAHRQLLDVQFVHELISRLEHHLNDYNMNWQNELALMVITMIATRVFSICDPKTQDKAADLVIKCRKTGEEWITHISANIQTTPSLVSDDVKKLRLKLMIIGITCLLTFSADSDRLNCLLSSEKDIIFLLKTTKIVHDNNILNNNQLILSTFLKNIISFSQQVLVMVQPKLAKLLREESYQSLNEFVITNYYVFQNTNTTTIWKKRRNDEYDGWYDCQYGSRHISIDCIGGEFLVDGRTVDLLAQQITNNELYVRVFGQKVFGIQTTESNTYITEDSSHGQRVQYKFHFNSQTNYLIVKERYSEADDEFQLIPHTLLSEELPDVFVSNYSHWWNSNKQTIDFRPISFTNANFLSDKPYQLSMETKKMTTIGNIKPQTLIAQSSQLFQKLARNYFLRLDDEPYIYMMRDNTSRADRCIHIHLSRLGLAFKYDPREDIITSQEYTDMCIEKNQLLETLTGLKSGLILSPLRKDNETLGNYPHRKLIVPFGEIYIEGIYANHQIVAIRRLPSMPFSDQYFVFILNNRLQILQSTDSPAGWLYLALLHAMTSNPVPDKYTGMTGMESAFQLLNSPGCSSDQPYDPLCLNILCQIAGISPTVSYYPENLRCMQKIEWQYDNLPYSMQHFGYYLITKQLIHDSQQLEFMHPSPDCNEIPEIFKGKLDNEILLKQLYWAYRDSYNSIARLSKEMESNILDMPTKVYEPKLNLPSYKTHYNVMKLVDDLYEKGDVELKDYEINDLLPLSQWLNREDHFKNAWIGLLKLADSLRKKTGEKSTEDIERFDILLNFLHYISRAYKIKPCYLQMLKTVLKQPSVSLASVKFPSFIPYENIEEVSCNEAHLPFLRYHTPDRHNAMITEIRRCWSTGRDYTNDDNLVTRDNTVLINRLLKSWRSNKKLRLFLQEVQALVCLGSIQQLETKVSYKPQQFELELSETHHQIKLKHTEQNIDATLLLLAGEKFRECYSGPFNKTTDHIPTIDSGSTMLHGIFSSDEDQQDPLYHLTTYFQNQLRESCSKLSSDRCISPKLPSVEEITKLLNDFQEKSEKIWEALVKSIIESDKQLFEAGLAQRIVPTTLISLFLQKTEHIHLTDKHRTLLGGILVCWTLEQQLERALRFKHDEKEEDFENEIANTPHANWKPSEYIHWLLLELEMNITIREIQIDVARHMMQLDKTTDNSTVKNIVMQMNMGEGKTSVIVPMLALHLCSSKSLVRIVILKQLFSTNYKLLKYKLGGLLSRRIFPFACRRDMNFSNEQITKIDGRLKKALKNDDIILTSPEDILSFDLLTIDKCQRGEFDTVCSMLKMQRWLKTYARDVLDESDEILHVKYQLIFTVGDKNKDGVNLERWETIQLILDLVKKHVAGVSDEYKDDIVYKSSKRKSAFPEVRLQSHKPFASLCKKITNDWIERRSYRKEDKKLISDFILKKELPNDSLKTRFPNDFQSFLIFRGLFSLEVLLDTLKKRYRVNYGVDSNSSPKRSMAVPFRAKDVADERTEFGHPDVAVILTQFAYYYSGLDDHQLIQCFNRLSEEESDPDSIYSQWILYDDENIIPSSIKQWRGVNIKDNRQRTEDLFPTFQCNMLVINYFLNHFVFKKEAKQYPYKIVSSAWDLSSSDGRSNIITGFSGTSDTQLLLPIHIRQDDLPELQKTNAIVIRNLGQSENESYQSLPIDYTSDELLKDIVESKPSINVILDVGALFIDGTNRDIAIKWLDLSNKDNIDYAVYFDVDSIVVCDRQFHCHRFETSPANERLDRCVFYLDEVHTRGTDFKFPKGFRAAVTLGNGLTKDRFVQACMRMRKLGNGHSLTFWSSDEVHQQIIKLKDNELDISLNNILCWLYKNTVQSTWDGLYYWAVQSQSYERKTHAHRGIDLNNNEQKFSKNMMRNLAKDCREKETMELEDMYGKSKVLETLYEIHKHYKPTNAQSSREINDVVLKRLRDYGGEKKRLSQLLNGEQQRELEQEVEKQQEQQNTNSLPAVPCKPIIHEQIKRLCQKHANTMDLSQFPKVFCHLPFAFNNTTFVSKYQPVDWQRNMWVSMEFTRVIENKKELDTFLRPPRWILFYRSNDIIFISAYEANELVGLLQSGEASICTLRLLLPRINRNQLIFVNNLCLTIPPSIASSDVIDLYSIPKKWLVQLFIFNGTLYFENIDEQAAYCKCLGLCPKPRTTEEEEYFEKGWTDSDGFVSNLEHRRHLKIEYACFNFNPLEFVKELLKNRNNERASKRSHVGSIIYNSCKLLE